MKKLLYKTALFIIPLGITCVIIFLMQPTEAFKKSYLKEDCTGRYQEISNRLTLKKQIDVLFIGSSKTMNAINDSLIEAQTHRYCYNAGYCRFGRNLDVLFIQKFTEQFQIKKIVLEVRETESYNSHPVFPMVANGREVLNTAKFFNQDFFSDVKNHFLFNVSWLRTQLNIEHKNDAPTKSIDLFGFWNGSTNIFDTTNYHLSTKKVVDLKTDATHYLKKIKELCQQKNIELYFLYLPNYNKNIQVPVFKNVYISLGTYISAPDSLYNNLEFYQNEGHFNEKGAELFSQHLISIIRK